MKLFDFKTVKFYLVLLAVYHLLRFLLTDSASARETMCTVPMLIFIALVIHGATYAGKKR